MDYLHSYEDQVLPHVRDFVKKYKLTPASDYYFLDNIKLDKNTSQISLPKLTIQNNDFKEIKNIRPKSSVISSVELKLTFGVVGEEFHSNSVYTVHSICKGNTQTTCFHLDSISAAETKSQNFFHPIHHFQFGGSTLMKLGDEGGNSETFFGSMLVIDCPRISFPPVDLSLALHFILTNFVPKKSYVIESEPHFYRQVQKAQEIFWRPYFDSVSNFFKATDKGKDEIARHYLPQLLP